MEDKKGRYRVSVLNLGTGHEECVPDVPGDGFRDAALTAAETPFDSWQTVPAVPQEDMSFLQERAKQVADWIEDADYAEGNGNHLWDVYDPMRSSNGFEYVMSPRSTGFYGVAGGKYLKVEISYVTDPERIEELKQEFEED